MLVIRRVEIHQVIRPPGGDAVKEFCSQVAVRIDDTDTPAGLNVLDDEVSQQRGFPSSCLPDDVAVMSPVGSTKPERLDASPDIACADVREIFIHVRLKLSRILSV